MTDVERIQQELGIVLNPEKMPQHIAIIMDGNGRWATQRNLPRVIGHHHGYQTTRKIVRACGDLNLTALTLYTFSTENWRRPKEETDTLMALIEEATRRELPTLQENNIKFMVSGRVHELNESLQDTIAEVSSETSSNTGLTLNLAINYGGRQEILDAIQDVCNRAKDSHLSAEEITEEYFSNMLYTAKLPDPDLMVRTAGELRISNFLLWQIAYAEIWVTSTLWPDFDEAELIRAIDDYQRRIRKFGTVAEDDAS